MFLYGNELFFKGDYKTKLLDFGNNLSVNMSNSKDTDFNYTTNDFFESYNLMKGFSRVNLLIGPNNSGKSRFIRKLFIDEFELIEINQEIESILNEIEIQLESIISNISFIGTKDKEKYVEWLYNIIRIHSIYSSTYNNDLIHEKLNSSEYYRSYLVRMKLSDDLRYPSIKSSFNAISDLSRELQKLISKKDNYHIKFDQNIYIPLIRGTRRFTNYFTEMAQKTLDNENIKGNAYEKLVKFDIDVYAEKTKDDYFGNKIISDKKQIFSGYDIYEDIKTYLLGDRKKRDIVKKFENYLSIMYFDNTEVSILPNHEENVLKMSVDNEEHAIQHWGDGFQSLLILSWPIFKHSTETKKLALYIEEPELYLHPGFLRKFFAYVIEECPNVYIFANTHSNHLIDLSNDYLKVSLFHFSKLNKGTFKIKNLDNSKKILLDSLGVKYSSVMLSNCIIWIEGPSDRIYLNKYLELYQNHLEEDREIYYKENIHFSYVMYGGNLITSYEFEEECENDLLAISGINKNSIVIHDSDGVKEEGGKFETIIKNQNVAKIKRFTSLRDKLGTRFLLTPGREIENTVSINMLKELVLEYEDKNEIKIEFKDNINSDKFKKEQLGTFIDKNLIKDISVSNKFKIVDGKSYAYGKEKTIQNKVKFAKDIITKVNSFEDLDEETQIFIIKIYELIKEFNSN